jgi:hypothetical protein
MTMKKKKPGFKFWFYLIYRIFLMVAVIGSLIVGNFLNVGIALLALFITFIPQIIERRFGIHYPTEFEIAIMVFIYLSLILGSVGEFYDLFPWWDTMLHTISGILFGLLGFSLVYHLNRSSWEKIRLSRAFIALFAFCFALSLGAIWEIYEYLVDSLFGWNMQRSGLPDTMSDLILDALGAGIVSSAGYVYLKGNVKLFERLERWFASKRPEKKEIDLPESTKGIE